MKKILGGLALSISLMAPVAMQAQDHPRSDNARKDDAHEWNDNENTAYHRWLKEHHKKDHDWAKASKKEQQSYWAWRKDHPDSH